MSVSVGDMSHIAALTDPSPPQQELYVYGSNVPAAHPAVHCRCGKMRFPWSALCVASAPEGPLTEMICAENPNSFFPGTTALPISQAVVPDF